MQRSSSCWPSECRHMGVMLVLCWCHLYGSCVKITCRPCIAFCVKSRNGADWFAPTQSCFLSPLLVCCLVTAHCILHIIISWFDSVASLFVDFVRISSHLPQYAQFGILYHHWCTYSIMQLVCCTCVLGMLCSAIMYCQLSVAHYSVFTKCMFHNYSWPLDLRLTESEFDYCSALTHDAPVLVYHYLVSLYVIRPSYSYTGCQDFICTGIPPSHFTWYVQLCRTRSGERRL